MSTENLTIDPAVQQQPAAQSQPQVTDPTKVTAAPGTPEYEQQMAAIGAAHRQQFESTRPEWLPEKFWNAESGQANLEALAKSYAELERTRGGQPAAQPAAQAAPNQAAPQQAPTQETVESAWTEKFSQEVATSGALSEASYAELAAKGFSKSFVDRIIAGEQALAERDRNSILETVGGASQFETMKSWAAANLSADELKTFNSQVVASVDSSKMALQWLKTRYESANGSAPQLLTGGSSAAPSNGFRSQEEVVAAVRDARYQRDPAYRAEVARRLAAKQF